MSPGDRTISLSLAYLWIALEMSLSNKRQKLDYYIEARELARHNRLPDLFRYYWGCRS